MSNEIVKTPKYERVEYGDGPSMDTLLMSGSYFDVFMKMHNSNMFFNPFKRMRVESKRKNIAKLTEFQDELTKNLESASKLKISLATHSEVVERMITFRREAAQIAVEEQRDNFLTMLEKRKAERELEVAKVETVRIDNMTKISQLKISELRSELLNKFKTIDLEKLTASSTFAMDRLLNPVSNYGADITGREAIRDQMVEKMKRENLILEANIKRENADAEIKAFNVKKEIEEMGNG